MLNEDKMTIDERYKYLRIMQKKYSEAKHNERSQLLDRMEEVTGLHRKSLIRLLHGTIARQPRRKQRGKTYGPEVDDALRVIYESYDYICAERLTPNLVSMAKQLAAHGELRTSPSLLQQLQRISISTVRRKLKALDRLDQYRLPRCRGPRPAKRLTRHIPMKRIPWYVSPLPFVQGLRLPRSRPFHKNDNRFVEQRNNFGV